MITILINTDGIENAENKLSISTNLQMMLWNCQLHSRVIGGRYMVKLTDIQMLLTRRFGSIATNGLGLYAVAKLRWVVGGFAIADIARVIGCPFIRINNLKTIICY